MLTIILGVKHVFLQPVDYQIFNVKVKGEDLPVVFSNIKKKCVSFAAGSVFGPKDSPASVVGGLSTPNHHDPWNRLHGGPPGFSAGPSWAKGADKRDERERVKEGERRDIPHIKDEKDRYEIKLVLSQCRF